MKMILQQSVNDDTGDDTCNGVWRSVVVDNTEDGADGVLYEDDLVAKYQ